MTEEQVKRKLTAILSADVKGYSRLMEDDEETTVRTITAYREVMVSQTHGQNGRVVDAKGDNILAEFPSVVDAVRCAVKIQKELRARNADLPEHRRMEFRIGINLGDVIQEDDTIYGDGVNIAARLEALADGGGICISGSAYEQVGKKLPIGYEYLGEQRVKNIEKPVRAYKILLEPEAAGKLIGEERPTPRRWRWAVALVAIILVGGGLAIWNYYLRPPPIEPASVERMAFPLPDKPSIAVLPFVNMSGDPNQEYIADGITENIISALSKISKMFVIARQSTFTYKGKSVKVQQVSEDLGVRHLLEGSVQRSNDRVRITAQLVDATSGHSLWAEQYDRDMKGLFDLLDEITKEIVVALQVELTEGEQARIWYKRVPSLEVWGYFIRAASLFEHFTKEDNAKARELLERIVKLEPEYATAWTMLAWTYWIDARWGWSESPAESFKRAVELAQKAVALDDSSPDVHCLLGGIYLMQKQHEQAIAEGKKSIALAPNSATSHILLAETMYNVGRFEEAIVLVKKAMRLHPYYSAWYLSTLADSHAMAGHYEEALAVNKQLLDRSLKGEYPPLWVHVSLAANYIGLGQEKQARAHAAEVLRIDPNFSLEMWSKAIFFKYPSHLKRFLDYLRKAGLPDKPPPPLPDKPSIAVLPFVNMSGGPNQEYFSDGITEAIITALSKVEKLFVIARNSTFTYKGKPVKVQQVARDLGVQYVLEGSVQKYADRIRITAQLIDAPKGHHLWAERYDRHLKDLFDLQDEITMKIITALEVELTEGEQALVAGSGTDNLDAYLKILPARDLKRHQTIESNHKARRLARTDPQKNQVAKKRYIDALRKAGLK